MYHNNESILYTQWKSKQFLENYLKKENQVEIIPGILKKSILFSIFLFLLWIIEEALPVCAGHDSHPCDLDFEFVDRSKWSIITDDVHNIDEYSSP